MEVRERETDQCDIATARKGMKESLCAVERQREKIVYNLACSSYRKQKFI